jgi:ubiquinone/menaquinone biosynthesis C-methylase UbiE
MRKYIRNIGKRFKDALTILTARSDDFNKYVVKFPSYQNAINLFENEWASSLPAPFNTLKAGDSPLFEDDRIKWAISQLGGIQGKTVLELGPLEGGHAYMLQNHGAASIVSIEANPRAFLKCLIIKQMLKLDRVEFLCGDFMEYLKVTDRGFDLCLASGVLYHMPSPVELISLIARSFSQMVLWTHYYDPEICMGSAILKTRFSKNTTTTFQGFEHTLHHYSYGSARTWNKFCGGPEAITRWLSREDILNACRHFGFTDIQIDHEKRDNLNGPSFTLVAKKPMSAKS